jgi:hypothetical protein
MDWRLVQVRPYEGVLSSAHQHLAVQAGVALRKTFWTHLTVGIDPLRLHIPVITFLDKNLASYSSEVADAVDGYKSNRLSLAVFSIAYAW